MKRSLYFLLLFLVGVLSGCSWKKDRLDVDVSKISIPDVKIYRYDQDLFRIPLTDLKGGLQAIQHKYYFFLAANLDDPANLERMSAYLQNPRNLEFQKAVEKKFTDVSFLVSGLTDLFRHYEYYFPGKKIPRIYTFISGGDYDNQVRLADSVLIIAIDTYLGADFTPFKEDGLPVYKVDRMTPEHIVPDAARELVNTVDTNEMNPMTLLDHFIEAGKRIYLVKCLLPKTSDDLIFDYSPKKYEWMKNNESHVWAAIIENRMLFSGSSDLLRAFFADGPCTTDFGKDSPPRMGEWLGYRIVKDYMQNNPDVSVQDLIGEKDSQKILRKSGYKPEK
jgi:hypothetical protein